MDRPLISRKNRTGTTANGKQAFAGFSAIDRKEVRPRAKYQVICMNRRRYSISAMCRFFGISRSGYYDYVNRLGQRAHDADLADIIREQQEKCDRTYRCGSG